MYSVVAVLIVLGVFACYVAYFGTFDMKANVGDVGSVVVLDVSMVETVFKYVCIMRHACLIFYHGKKADTQNYVCLSLHCLLQCFHLGRMWKNSDTNAWSVVLGFMHPSSKLFLEHLERELTPGKT
jgi:hypothetical protein